MLYTKVQGNRSFGSGEEDIEMFLPWPSWSCDLDRLKDSFGLSIYGGSYESWLQLAQYLQTKGLKKYNEIVVTLAKVRRMTVTSGTHKS